MNKKPHLPKEKTEKAQHVFKHDYFQLSTDYNRLWELINSGGRIPAWIVYTDEYEEPIWDLVEVKVPEYPPQHLRSGEYRIGTRGIGYEYSRGLEDFLIVCNDLSLRYICPSEK